MDLMHLCRLCMVEDGGDVPIFANEAPERIIKITTCLPVKISRDDCLPKGICNDCASRLDASYEFWNASLNAEEKLSMLSKQISIKLEVDSDEAEVVQIKNEPFDVKETRDDRERTIVLKSREQLFFEQFEIACDLDLKCDASEVDPLSHNVSQHPDSTSPSFQMRKRNKRHAAIKNISLNNKTEDVGDSDINKEFTLATNNDICENAASRYGCTVGVTAINIRDCDDNVVKHRLKSAEQKLMDSQKLAVLQSIMKSAREEAKRKSQNCKSAQRADLKPFKCPFCENKFKYFRDLDRHVRMHIDYKQYKCSVCEYESIRSDNLKYHMRKHTGEKPYKCNICEFKCSRHVHLETHALKHTGEKPFKCGVCDYESSQGGHLKIHMHKHTVKEPL